jgi:hypothetical protein
MIVEDLIDEFEEYLDLILNGDNDQGGSPHDVAMRCYEYLQDLKLGLQTKAKPSIIHEVDTMRSLLGSEDEKGGL